MSESNSDKNREIDKPDRGEKSNMSRYTYIIQDYFKAFPLREKPLPGLVRFFFAWLGSMFATAPIDIDIESVKLASENPSLPETFSTVEKMGLMYISFAAIEIVLLMFLSALFALVIAWSKTRHGPIGLFLFGMVFTAFVASFAAGYSSFWDE